MGKSDSRGQGVQVGAVATLEVDPDTFAAFDGLPGRSKYSGIDWTKKQDFLLLKYWPIKDQKAVARALGVCLKAARKRYQKLLTEGEQCKS
jgi:hypothetical protein